MTGDPKAPQLPPEDAGVFMETWIEVMALDVRKRRSHNRQQK